MKLLYNLSLASATQILICALFAFCLFTLFLKTPLNAAPLSVPQSTPDSPGLDVLKTLLNDIDGQSLEIINIQRELVTHKALNPEDGGDGEESKARWIESWLHKNNLPAAEHFDTPDERVSAKIRPNLIIRYPGKSERTLWIVGHLDVSPPGELTEWTSCPWALRIEGDFIYGRGVEDNNQSITAGLILLNSLNRNRITPPISLGLILVSGEKYSSSPSSGIVVLLQKKR